MFVASTFFFIFRNSLFILSSKLIFVKTFFKIFFQNSSIFFVVVFCNVLYDITLFLSCQQLFIFVLFSNKDNGERGIWTLAPLLTTYSLSRGAPSTTWVFLHFFITIKKERRGWDSNPRALSDKRFSRPPRYDRFDTSPYELISFLLRSMQEI